MQLTEEEARDIAFSMAEDEESNRQAEAQMAAAEAAGHSRPHWDDESEQVRNIEDEPF